jgi:hypothetical protein
MANVHAVANSIMIPVPPAGDKFLMTVSGVVVIDAVKGTSANWLQQSRQFDIAAAGTAVAATGIVPAAGFSLAFLVEQFAAYATLNSISNDNQAINAGWALDSYAPAWNPPHGSITFNGGEQIFGGTVFNTTSGAFQTFPGWFSVNLAVRDTDGFILRVGYYMTLLGKVIQWH